MTTTGASSQLNALSRALLAQLSELGEPGNRAAVSLWDAGIQRRSAAVADGRDARDVSRALAAARAAKRPLSVRDGGHNLPVTP